MFNMTKSHKDSKFAVFENGSVWYDCIFNYIKYNKDNPICPNKREDNYFDECDNISVLQIQSENNDRFMIEYIIV